MPLDFPSSPTLNQIYTSSGTSWKWNGYAWDAFNPYEGLKFEFKGTMAVFFDGCPAAIVEITSNGETILSYQDGKSALLE